MSLARFFRDTRGQTAIEYGLIAGCIALLIIAAVSSIGEETNASFEAVQAGFTPPQ